jgi:hypothetical protein
MPRADLAEGNDLFITCMILGSLLPLGLLIFGILNGDWRWIATGIFTIGFTLYLVVLDLRKPSPDKTIN